MASYLGKDEGSESLFHLMKFKLEGMGFVYRFQKINVPTRRQYIFNSDCYTLNVFYLHEALERFGYFVGWHCG